MPKPATTIAVATYSRVVAASMRAKRIMPIATSTDPATPSILYSPVREIVWPPTMLATTTPIRSGVRRLPDCVADTPRTPCMNSGK